jgi:hypothetical protein
MMRPEFARILNTYTPEDLELFSKISEETKVAIPFLNMRLRLGAPYQWFCTEEGFADQVTRFREEIGLLYYFVNDNGYVEIQKTVIHRHP